MSHVMQCMDNLMKAIVESDEYNAYHRLCKMVREINTTIVKLVDLELEI